MCLFTCDFYQFLAQIHIYGMPLGQSMEGKAKFLIHYHVIQWQSLYSAQFLIQRVSTVRLENLEALST